LLAVLAADPDQMIREIASGVFVTLPMSSVVAAIARPEAPLQLFAYCAAELGERPGIADALANNTHCPADLLRPAARYLTTSAVQTLVEDLDRLSTSPGLAALLMMTPSLTAEQRQMMEEIQQDHFLSDELFAQIGDEVEPDQAKRQTLLQKLARMHVAERVQLALKGNREDRMVLIRDPCKVVQRAVLQSARITDTEVEGFAAMASLTDEILRLIAGNRKFRKDYTVTRNLINNPKTPLDVSLHLLPTINPVDLKSLSTNKNVADTLRNSALRLVRIRAKPRNDS